MRFAFEVTSNNWGLVYSEEADGGEDKAVGFDFEEGLFSCYACLGRKVSGLELGV